MKNFLAPLLISGMALAGCSSAPNLKRSERLYLECISSNSELALIRLEIDLKANEIVIYNQEDDSSTPLFTQDVKISEKLIRFNHFDEELEEVFNLTLSRTSGVLKVNSVNQYDSFELSCKKIDQPEAKKTLF